MRRKESALGTASFIISICSGLMTILLVLGLGIIEDSRTGSEEQESATAVVINALIIAFICLNFVSAGIGTAGLFSADRGKTLAICGIVFALGANLVFFVDRFFIQ
tara:strand:- start:146 stop:463 length:318 start_codon:yes stop_codon:yes gene_type:complete